MTKYAPLLFFALLGSFSTSSGDDTAHNELQKIMEKKVDEAQAELDKATDQHEVEIALEKLEKAKTNAEKAAKKPPESAQIFLREATAEVEQASKELGAATDQFEAETALDRLEKAKVNAKKAAKIALPILREQARREVNQATDRASFEIADEKLQKAEARLKKAVKEAQDIAKAPNNIDIGIKTTSEKKDKTAAKAATADKSITNLRKAMVEVEKAQRELQNASPEVVGSNPETIKLAQENLQKAKKKAKLAAQIANKRFKALVENAAKDLEQAQRELFGASSVNAAADKLQQAKKRLKQLRQKVSKIAKAEESLGVSATPIQNIAGINACLKNLDIDLPVLKNVSQLCKKAIQKSLKPKQFSLSITKNGDECTVQPKWAKQIPLKSKEALECLGLKAQSQLGEAIEKDPPYTLSSPDEEIRILYKDKKILTGNCRKGLELILETSDDDDEDEDKKKNEEEDDEEEKKVKTFHQCQWSIRYHGNDISLAGSEDDGLTIKGEDGFKVSVENEGKVNCDIVKGKYDCLHEIDDSSHSVTLSVSKGDESKSETCKIPSRQELMEELGMVPLLPVTPVTPPKPIRYNFGGAILSPEVY